MPNPCSVTGCKSPSFARGWCTKHYQRWRAHGNPYTMKRAPNGAGSTNGRGYRERRVWRNGKLVTVRENRMVAEEALGRKLEPFEVVHHIDGNKTNNCPMNLAVMHRDDHTRLHRGARVDWELGLSLRKEGMGYDKISVVLGCSRETCHRRLKALEGGHTDLSYLSPTPMVMVQKGTGRSAAHP